MFLGTGMGYAETTLVREWYGRGSVLYDYRDDSFGLTSLQVIIAGIEAGGHPQPIRDSYNILSFDIAMYEYLDGYETYSEELPLVDTFRFGGELWFPGALFGMYINTGEMLDFVLGFATIDISDDDAEKIVTVKDAIDYINAAN